MEAQGEKTAVWAAAPRRQRWHRGGRDDWRDGRCWGRGRFVALPTESIWCPGCTPGTGMCSPGGCPGVACAPTTGTQAQWSASGPCSTAATAAACDARAGCHSVFLNPNTCRCAALGCCAHFSKCAEGAQAIQEHRAQLHDRAAVLRPSVIAYSNGCYEGCVRMTECTP